MWSLSVFDDLEELSQQAALRVADHVRQVPDSLLCLASGATPSRTYSLLVEREAREPGLFGRARAIKLDEWGGLARSDPASCEEHLVRSLVHPLGMRERYVAFDGSADCFEAECDRVARWLGANGPIEFAILGLGVNGHIGFNEPAARLMPHAHVARLSPESLGHAMVKNSPVQPTCGLTLGIADLLQARRVLLLVSGANKRGPLTTLLAGMITTQLPASLLLAHANLEVLCDREAAA